MQRFAVIMAGGGGTRFWPLSRQNAPKQILNIIGNDVMINETIKRYEGVISIDKSFIVTNKSQKKLLEEIVIPEIPRVNILSEPVGRNTAPCILYAAMRIYEKYGDGIMCVFPSDHYITDIDGFQRVLKNAIAVSENNDMLSTIGIKPTFPSIEYGYIKRGTKVLKLNTYLVSRFVEKPNISMARRFIKSGDYYWNSGMFIWKVSVIINAFKRFLPRLYQKLQRLEGIFGTSQEEKMLKEIYSQLDNISVDYGILERTDEILVIPGDFGWNDVGSWDVLSNIFPIDECGNVIKANHLGIDTKGCIVYGVGKLIATIGLENTIIVNTDDALMICPKEKAKDVKKVVELLKEMGKTELI